MYFYLCSQLDLVEGGSELGKGDCSRDGEFDVLGGVDDNGGRYTVYWQLN